MYGSPLFGDEKNTKSQKKHAISEEEVGYVQIVRRTIDGEMAERVRLSKEYETEMYRSHQLFRDSWKPESKHIAEIEM